MRNYTAHDIEEMLNHYEHHITHVIVAHTKHRPYIASLNTGRFKHVKAESYIRAKYEETSKSSRYALNCFYKMLYPNSPNKVVRQPSIYKPLTFATIEGAKETTDQAQTIHVNIALGNLPKDLSISDIEAAFRHAWCDKAGQSSDIKVVSYSKIEGQAGWNGYSLKEAQQDNRRAWDTNSVLDVGNCWIPHDALKAD